MAVHKLLFLPLITFLIISNPLFAQTLEDIYPAPGKTCLTAGCHEGIEPIREHHSGMARAIYKEGIKAGDPNGCVVCHFGNPLTGDKQEAHRGIIRYPASMWILDKTCSKCHKDHSYAMHRNLMQTEAGKIQGAVWGWGALTGYESVYGNYNIDDPDGMVPLFGTGAYRDYMESLMQEHAYAFPGALKKLPSTQVDSLIYHPEQAVFTYLRGDCLRCHVGVRGKQRRGDFRGLGCAACHIPYSDAGYYEGKDPCIPKDEQGKLLVHSMQSSRKAKVTVNGVTYSGIPGELCTTCHNRGKRIGVSFLGLMESPYDTPWNPDGSSQAPLHGKKYQFIQDDFHHSLESREGNPRGRILCQDCHHSTDVHGNGNIGGTTLGEVEIECFDCHGTPGRYPWELPLGFGDEFGITPAEESRGLAERLLEFQEKYGTVYEKENGYLLTARGNPFGNVVKRDDGVVLHSASGLDFNVPVLKNLVRDNSFRNPVEATTAMVGVKKHIQTMECYTCHSSWAAQCYGCHVKVDYSNASRSMDWVASGNAHFPNGETAETSREQGPEMMPGKITEGRTYTRHEDPILGINGEGRVSPLITGCQQITTVIGPDGKVIISNKIWRTPPYLENSGEQGQRGIDMSPAHPHTVTARARPCVSCHANPKALGYGISDNAFMQGYQKNRYTDVQNEQGELLSKRSTPQIPMIEGLDMDLSQIVTRDGEQVQTVGHHWNLSGPLSAEQRGHMERIGTCIACHREIPDGNAAVSALVKTGQLLNLSPYSDGEHAALLNRDLKFVATVQLLMPVLLVLLIIFIIRYYRLKRRVG